MKKNVIELQDELTTLIEKKKQNLNIVNINELIQLKKNEVMEALEKVQKA